MIIERNTTQGYESTEYSLEEAIKTLNLELENKRSVWIDNKLFSGEFILKEDIEKAKSICVTNKLVGG